MVGDKGAFPVMLLEKCGRIIQDLRKWAERKPEKWFTLDIIESGDKYSVCLMPNLRKSVERFKHNYLMATGKTADKFKVITRPIFFGSNSATTFSKIKSEIRSEVVCGFAPYPKWNEDNLQDIQEKDIMTIGPLKVRWNPQDKIAD